MQIREEGILVLSGGFIIHNLRDRSSFSPHSAKPALKEFDKAMLASVTVADVCGTFSRIGIHSSCAAPGD
jgi:aromatic ring-opening dioxygenase catalytic subunit (LigB family)